MNTLDQKGDSCCVCKHYVFFSIKLCPSACMCIHKHRLKHNLQYNTINSWLSLLLHIRSVCGSRSYMPLYAWTSLFWINCGSVYNLYPVFKLTCRLAWTKFLDETSNVREIGAKCMSNNGVRCVCRLLTYLDKHTCNTLPMHALIDWCISQRGNSE